MFEYRKANRSKSTTVRRPSKLNLKGSRSSTESTQSQAAGLAYIRALKANLQRSASQILAGPQTQVDSLRSSPTSTEEGSTSVVAAEIDEQTDAEIQALADEKDRIAVADELQRYIEEGLLEEAEYTNDFSLTRYWQVSIHSSLHSPFFSPRLETAMVFMSASCHMSIVGVVNGSLCSSLMLALALTT
jgi:hypothetical protein